MIRAIQIDPGNTAGSWIDLAGASVNAAVRGTLGAPDYTVIHRDNGPLGRGVQLAVYEYSLLNGSPRNDLASRVVGALGFPWAVHGRCLLLGLNGPASVDLVDAQWRYLAAIAARYVIVPTAKARS